MPKIAAIINQKGGVGKTTTAINLSCSLAMQGSKVLLIDLDPQAHSTIGLGIPPGQYKYAIHNVLLKNKTVNDVILETQIENLFIVPSHIRLERAEQQITPEMFKEVFLYDQIEHIDYDFIIIDCRPSLGTLTVNALYACNLIVIPCEASRYSLEGFSDLMDTIDGVKKFNKKNKSIRILITKFESRSKITNEWLFGELEAYNDFLFQTIIRKTEALNQAHIARQPIFLFKPSSPGAEDYNNLTNEFLTLWQT
jgi:chromosome partitioning protein